MVRRRPDRHPDAELARACAHRERQDARDTHHGDHQRHSGKSPEDERIQPIGREHLGPNIVERGRALDRLVGIQLADDPPNWRNERVGIGANVHEQPPCSAFLVERVIDVEDRAWHHVLIVEVGHDADNSPGRGAEIDELADRIGPDQMPIERILVWKQSLGDTLTDDDGHARRPDDRCCRSHARR